MTNIEKESVLKQAIIDALFEYEEFMNDKFVDMMNDHDAEKESITALQLKLDMNVVEHETLERSVTSIMKAYQYERREVKKGKIPDSWKDETGE